MQNSGNPRILVRGQKSFDPRGALTPKFAQNRGFPLKLPENCIILKKIWGVRGQAPRAPWRAKANTCGWQLIRTHLIWNWVLSEVFPKPHLFLYCVVLHAKFEKRVDMKKKSFSQFCLFGLSVTHLNRIFVKERDKARNWTWNHKGSKSLPFAPSCPYFCSN